MSGNGIATGKVTLKSGTKISGYGIVAGNGTIKIHHLFLVMDEYLTELIVNTMFLVITDIGIIVLVKTN